MEYLDTIRLGFGHNLIIGNAPPAVSAKLGEVVATHNKGMDFSKLGFWDSAAPNFETYYPDVTPEDLKPKNEDFINPIYRALSETIVHKDYNPIDFSKNNALKKSTSLLVGQTIYANHEAMVGNELGAVAEASWEKSYKTEKGIIIPAGINAMMRVDGKSHPNLARKITMDPPAVHSTSVTVQFMWDKSHPTLSEEEFWRKLGSFDEEGEMYRRIVTKIKRYTEISFVSHGADPYAQKVNEKGEIVNPTEADIRSNKEENAPKQKFFFYDFQHDLVSNEEKNTIPTPPIKEDSSHSKNTNMNKAFLVALAAVMGLKGEEFSEDKLTEDIIKNKLQALISAGETDSDELTRLRAIETEYNKIKDVKPVDNTKLTELTSFKEKIEKGLRTEVTGLKVKLSADGKVSDAIKEMIENAGYPILLGLREQYQVELDAKYPSSCKSCGSTEVSRASAAVTEDDETQNNDDTHGKKCGTQTAGDKSLSELINQKRMSSNIPLGERPPAEEKK